LVKFQTLRPERSGARTGSVARRSPEAARQIRSAVATPVHTFEEIIEGLDPKHVVIEVTESAA
jgi:hypothetical protein